MEKGAFMLTELGLKRDVQEGTNYDVLMVKLLSISSPSNYLNMEDYLERLRSDPDDNSILIAVLGKILAMGVINGFLKMRGC